MSVDWAAEGLLDRLEGQERESRIALLDLLEAEGVKLDEIHRSDREGELLFLLAGRAIDIEYRYSWDELVEKSGLDEELVTRLIRAQGMARADGSQAFYTDYDLGLLRTTGELLTAGVGEDEVVTVGRLLGRGFAQAAEAMRGVVMRLALEPGLDERELALRYAQAAGSLTPMVEPLLGDLLRVHLSNVVQTELLGAEERATGRLAGARPVTVAFADLVGFTRLGEQIPADELGAVAGRLEQLVLDTVEAPVRFVKTIGDAAMLVCAESPPLLDRTLELVERAEAEGPDFPQLRAGLAAGPALSRAGDVFGHPVNLASRITTIARPGSVLTTTEVQETASDAYRWSKAGVKRLKGVEEAVPLWRARRHEADDQTEPA